MTSSQIKAYVIFIFKEFYEKVNGTQKYRFDKNDRSALDNFIEVVLTNHSEELSKKWLLDFLEFSWDYQYNVKRRNNNKIRLTWIVGKPAYQRWLNSLKSESYWKARRKINKELNLEIGMSVEISDSSLSLKQRICSVNETEEIEKKRFFGTKEGYLWCSTNTSMYNHRSMNCTICPFKSECKERTKNKIPKTYAVRGYA